MKCIKCLWKCKTLQDEIIILSVKILTWVGFNSFTPNFHSKNRQREFLVKTKVDQHDLTKPQSEGLCTGLSGSVKVCPDVYRAVRICHLVIWSTFVKTKYSQSQVLEWKSRSMNSIWPRENFYGKYNAGVLLCDDFVYKNFDNLWEKWLCQLTVS